MRRHRRFGMLALALAGALFICQAAAPGVMAAPPAPPAPQPAQPVIWEAKTRDPLIALTFDDGPDAVYTPQILNLLKRHSARATFFVSGVQAQQHTKLLAREAAEGHQIGNHSYRHMDLRTLSPDQLRQELQLAANLIRTHTGRAPTVFRPPHGQFQAEMVDVVHQMGYHMVLWTGSTNSDDSWLHPTTDQIVAKILSGVKPGAIILLHDHGGDRSPTVAAVATVLEKLSAQGYRFVTLDDLLQAH